MFKCLTTAGTAGIDGLRTGCFNLSLLDLKGLIAQRLRALDEGYTAAPTATPACVPGVIQLMQVDAEGAQDDARRRRGAAASGDLTGVMIGSTLWPLLTRISPLDRPSERSSVICSIRNGSSLPNVFAASHRISV